MRELFIFLVISIVISTSVFYDIYRLNKIKEENQEKVECQIISAFSDSVTIKYKTMTSTVKPKKQISPRERTIKCYIYQGELYLDKFEADMSVYTTIYIIVIYIHLFLIFMLSLIYMFKKNLEINEA